ncbi:MAG: acyl-CoA dehydrogenase family protein [Spirochaetota bacterium]|nr:acyl-CoA dehydrogenase family protein [Spirochaetota bacterium]
MGIYVEEHEIFRDSLKKFIENEIVPNIDEWEEIRDIPRSIWKKMGELGFLCPWVEEQYGGSGVGFEYSSIIIYELARTGIGLGIASHNDIIIPYVADFGNHEQKLKWLPGCTTGNIIGSIAMSEPNAGSDLKAIQTTAIKDGDHYIVNGQKTFITNGYVTDLAIVACKTDPHVNPPTKGISLLAIERDTPGFSIGRKLNKVGLHTETTSELIFEDCRVPVANLLGEEGKAFTYMMSELQRERLVCVIWAQGMAERILDDVVEYCKVREAFGQPIGNFQHNAFKLAEMSTDVEMGKVFLDRLLEEYIGGINIVDRVSMAKWWIPEMANRVAYHALQLHGGYGYIEEYPIARFFRDVRGQTLYGGTTEVMKMIIARNMGFKA